MKERIKTRKQKDNFIKTTYDISLDWNRIHVFDPIGKEIERRRKTWKREREEEENKNKQKVAQEGFNQALETWMEDVFKSCGYLSMRFRACRLHLSSRNQAKGMLEVPWLAVELRSLIREYSSWEVVCLLSPFRYLLFIIYPRKGIGH